MPQTVHLVGDPQHPTRLIDDPDDTANPVLDFFLDYWRRSRGDAPLPLNTTFDPKVIRQHLQWVTSADALPDYEDFRFRVVASRTADYFLGNGTGKTIREAYAGIEKDFVESVLQLYRRASKARVPLRLTGPSSQIRSIYFPSYDSLYLPYSSDGVRTDRVVNIFWYDKIELIRRAATMAEAAR
jgi:hypothetical protein